MATAAPASEPLRRFLQVARGAGLKVSAAEGIDAARALDLVGFEDRTVLRDSLGLVLAKTPEEKAAYEEVFDIYFKRDEFTGGQDAIEDEAPGSDQDPFSSPANGAGGVSVTIGSREPDFAGCFCACTARKADFIARIWFGVVPQQPPRYCTPALRNFFEKFAIYSGEHR